MAGPAGVGDGQSTGVPPGVGRALAGVLALVSVFAVLGGRALGWVEFYPDVKWESIGTALLPFLTVALLIERSVQVIFGITRDPAVEAEEQRARAMKEALQLSGDSAARGSDAGVERARALVASFRRPAGASPGSAVRAADLADAPPADVARAAAGELADSEVALAREKARATRAAFWLSLSLGLMAAVLGFRVLSTVLVDVEKSWPRITLQPGATPTPNAAPATPTPPRAAAAPAGGAAGQPGGITPPQPQGAAPALDPAAAARQRAMRDSAARDSAARNNAAAPLRRGSPARRVYPLFVLLDILLTAGLLSGGANGIHHVTSVVGAFFQKTRLSLSANGSTPTQA